MVPHLLYAMGNNAYVDSQRQASIALAVSVHIYVCMECFRQWSHSVLHSVAGICEPVSLCQEPC